MSKIRTTNMVLSFCSLLNKNRRMGSYMLIFCLGVLLIFLSSCSTSTQNSSATPSHIVGRSDNIEPPQSSLSPVPSTQDTSSPQSFIDNENDTTSSSQPQLTSVPSVGPTQEIIHTPPVRPFPDLPPNYLQLPPQWLSNDFKDGNFTVTGDGIAKNYQAWYEFTKKMNKSKDAALTIQTFDLDLSKDRTLPSICGEQASRMEAPV